MPSERNDMTALFQRLADTLVRLCGDRIELARVELRDEAERLLRVAAALLLGAAAAGVGLVLIALAATDALTPLVASRPARLMLVGGPLLVWGGVRLARAVRALPGAAGENDDGDGAERS